jgi:hypothetical protein
MTKTLHFNGKTYKTASSCRFVIFGHGNDGTPYIYKRTGNVETAKKHRSHARYGLIVDYDYDGGRAYGIDTDYTWVRPDGQTS